MKRTLSQPGKRSETIYRDSLEYQRANQGVVALFCFPICASR